MEERRETRDKVEGVKRSCGVIEKTQKATDERCCMTTAPSAPWLQMWSRCRLTAQRVKVGEMVSRGDPVGKGGYWCLNLVDLMVESIKSCVLLDICWGTVTHTCLSEAFIAHSAQLRLHLRVCVSGPDGDRRLPEGSSRHNGWRRLSFEKIIDRSKFVPVFACDTVWTDVASVKGPLLTCVLKTQKPHDFVSGGAYSDARKAGVVDDWSE